MGIASTVATVRRWRNPRVVATGIIVGRKVEWERSAFVILLDLHFDYEGRSHQAQARAAAFDDTGQARAALAKWPIGSFRRVMFAPGCPDAVCVE